MSSDNEIVLAATKGGSTGAMIAKENERLSRSSLTRIPIGELEARFDYITVCTTHLFRSEGLARSNPLFSASARSRDSLVQAAALAHDQTTARGSFDRFSTAGKRGDVELRFRSSQFPFEPLLGRSFDHRRLLDGR
jgi:hypothetical protein